MSPNQFPNPQYAEGAALYLPNGTNPAPAADPASAPFDAGQIAAAAATAAGLPSAPPASDPMAMLDAFSAVNLDEVVVDNITLSFVEWDEAPLPEDAPADTPHAYVPRVVKKTIVGFVPMLVFNRSLKLFQQMQGAASDQEQQMALIASAVLLVWQLTEPTMTLQRLMMGLDWSVIMKLFTDFFAAKMRLIGLRVPGAGSLSNGRG